ncbi:MAG: DNA alkylation repair protein [Candidatus Marinimicrobia bacterium]|nr:DNA alkylation repair protein [Candidatus Neomarinimicrobiota bacterium]
MSDTAQQIISRLRSLGSPDNLAGMARYGISTDRAFGVKMGEVQALARQNRGDHKLALELWDSGYREARLLAANIADPGQVTPQLMDAWVTDFDSWDVCDTTCGKLFKKTPWAYDKARQWAQSEREFTRRAGFALMAYLALNSSKLNDDKYEPFLELIASAATDQRNLVKKAVNWALRQIGKRNQALNRRAIAVAEGLLAAGEKTARWIANDALRELGSERVQERLRR